MLEIGGDKVEAEELGGDDQALVLMEEGRIEKQEALVPLAQATRTLPQPPPSKEGGLKEQVVEWERQQHATSPPQPQATKEVQKGSSIPPL